MKDWVERMGISCISKLVLSSDIERLVETMRKIEIGPNMGFFIASSSQIVAQDLQQMFVDAFVRCMVAKQSLGRDDDAFVP
jgi:hypothetical protein